MQRGNMECGFCEYSPRRSRDAYTPPQPGSEGLLCGFVSSLWLQLVCAGSCSGHPGVLDKLVGPRRAVMTFSRNAARLTSNFRAGIRVTSKPLRLQVCEYITSTDPALGPGSSPG